MTDGMAARREAALRLPPLADGRHDPVLETPAPARRRRPAAAPAATCHFCGASSADAELAVVFGEHACRDRVDCYQRFKRGLPRSAR